MKAKIALAAVLGMIATTPAHAGARSFWATFEACVAEGESAGGGTDSTFTYACVPTSDGQWELTWARSTTTRDRPKRGGRPS